MGSYSVFNGHWSFGKHCSSHEYADFQMSTHFMPQPPKPSHRSPRQNRSLCLLGICQGHGRICLSRKKYSKNLFYFLKSSFFFFSLATNTISCFPLMWETPFHRNVAKYPWSVTSLPVALGRTNGDSWEKHLVPLVTQSGAGFPKSLGVQQGWTDGPLLRILPLTTCWLYHGAEVKFIWILASGHFQASDMPSSDAVWHR